MRVASGVHVYCISLLTVVVSSLDGSCQGSVGVPGSGPSTALSPSAAWDLDAGLVGALFFSSSVFAWCGSGRGCGMQTHRRQTQARVRGVANTRATVEERVSGFLGTKKTRWGLEYCRTRRERDHCSPQCACCVLAASTRAASVQIRPRPAFFIIITPRTNPSPGQLAHAD